MKIALVADELTAAGLALECEVRHVGPCSGKLLLSLWRPDLLLVESAWHGRRNAWKFRIAAYPDRPERNNALLSDIVSHARRLGIPTVFWNKEDGVHFERFIESAKLFDHIFTVDENCVSRYRALVAPEVTVNTLMFAVQPRLHFRTGLAPRHSGANFVGSYSRHIHDTRRQLQHMLFEAAADELGLTVYDRNSARRSRNYRYPDHIPIEVRPAVGYGDTAKIYRDHMVSLNVNTVQDSPTMFSRRLVEILACGGLAITTPALSVDRLFAPYCHVVHDGDEARELFARIARDGLSPSDREMTAAAAEHVMRHHTWSHRLRQMREVVGLEP